MSHKLPYSHLSVSASKAKTGQQEIAETIQNSLALVPIPEELDSLYSNNVFMTPKQRFHLESLAVFISRTVTSTYAAYDMLSDLISHGSLYEDLLEVDPTGQELASRVAKRMESRIVRMDTAFPANGKLIKEIRASLQAHMQGAPVIQDSVTKPGGKDIIVGGTPCPTTAVAGLGNFNLMQEGGSDRPMAIPGPRYESIKLSDYSSELSLAALRAADQISKILFGAPLSRSTVFDSKHHQLRLDTDFAQINTILSSLHPALATINIGLFQNFDPQAIKILDPFFRIGLRAMPSPQTVSRFIDLLKVNESGTVEITDEALALDVHTEACIVLALEPELVNYICQGETSLSEMCLFRWFKSWSDYYLRVRGGKKKGASKRSMVPRYVTSATVLPKLVELRKQFGYAVTESRADQNDLTAMPNGGFAVIPLREDIDGAMVSRYESDLNGVMSDLYSHGIPLSTDTSTLRTFIFKAQTRDLNFDETIQQRAMSLDRYSNIIVGSDPDFDVIVGTASSNGGTSVDPTYTVGSKKPTEIDTADILGFDFAMPGETPNFRSVNTVLDTMSDTQHTTYRDSNNLLNRVASSEAGYGRIMSGSKQSSAGTAPSIDINGDIGNLRLMQILSQVCAAYQYFSDRDLLPTVTSLVSDTRVGFPQLTSLADSVYDLGLYSGLITDDFLVNGNMPAGDLLMTVFTRVFNDAAGLQGSRMHQAIYRESGDTQTAAEQMPNHTHFFSMGKDSKLGDIARVYNYFGGQLLCEVARAISNAPRKALFASLSDSKEAPQGDRLVSLILPFCVLLSKIVPDTMHYFAQAEDVVSRLKKDEGIGADDIKVPGLKAGVALMPHQVGAHQYLRQRPRNAVLFIAPGGGKTILGITDIASLMHELDELGEEDLRPLIVCPTNLATTWADDLHKILDGWNCVPITTDTVNTWGEKRMYETLANAPRNTLFVTGLSFISGLSMNVDVGGVRIQIRGAVEFINRFKFNYVLLDESHKVKNFKGGQAGSAVHFNTKKIFTAPSIRYARIATGTLVTDRVTDVVGQAALLSPTIFGDSLDVAEDGTDSKSAMISRTHSRLSNHTAFINFKRKHWAFMLPNPIDTFITVDLDDPSVPNSELHLEVYNLMYAQLLEKLADAAKSARGKVSSGEDDDDSDGDDEIAGDDIGLDEEDGEGEADVLGNLLRSDAELRTYLQRMEQMLTDPMGDDICVETFKAAGVTHFVSAKVARIIEQIKRHFEVQPKYEPAEEGGFARHQTFEWSQGVTPREYDLAVYQGKKYMARKQSREFQRQTLPPSMLPPTEDPAYWKEERSGKLIVFCRYTRAVNCIYDALPPQYQKVAVRYHGAVGKFGEDRGTNLDAFKSSADCQIMIANEQAISEGHNMQMGSRIIRCDTPWSPGTYDQSTARIFRPDVSASNLDENGKPGDLARELVFIDWIMTNRTLEVGKVARLMWKTLEKVQFDEKGNKLYEPLEEYVLEPISMSPALLLSNNTIEDFMEYFQAKSRLNQIEAQEFADMRVSTVATMQPLTPYPPLKGFGILEHCPIVANQTIPDRHNHGLMRLLDWCRNTNAVDGDALRDALHLSPVVTEFGNGQIVAAKVRNVVINGKKVLKEDSPLSTVKVRLAGTEELITVSADKVHIATSITAKDMATFFKVNKPWATESDRKRANAAATVKEVETQEEDTREDDTDVELQAKARAAARAAARKKKRQQNQTEGKPINQGVPQAAETVRKNENLGAGQLSDTSGENPGLEPVAKPDAGASTREAGDMASGGDNKIVLTPTIYNGFIAIFADAADPDAATLAGLKGLSFIKFNPYLYIDCLYYKDFDRILSYLENIGDFDGPSEKRLEFIQDGFNSSGRMNFDVKQAQLLTSELKMFFQVMHRTSNDRTKIKAYPMVLEDRLRIMIDLKTNPMVKKLVGIKVPSTAKFGTFEKSEGMYISFCTNKQKAKAKISAVLKAGMDVTNSKKASAAITSMQLLPPKKAK